MTLGAIDNDWILRARGPKHPVSPDRPYAWLVEQERAASGRIEDVATIFLTNRECPFRCLMCDLWKNTTDQTIQADELVGQLQFALARLAEHPDTHPRRLAQWKLYNSGNFFDAQAIPQKAIPPLVELANTHQAQGHLSHLIIECHPRLLGDRCRQFHDALSTSLEVAMGLETIDPAVLPRLNKQMTLDDFRHGVDFLRRDGILVRAFILLKAPFQSEAAGLDWSLRSIEWAFAHGVDCCAVIPTRTGNGSLEQLQALGHFSEPRLKTLEQVIEGGLSLAKANQRLFVDLWDLERFSTCPGCVAQRRARLHRMNLDQCLLPPVRCEVCDPDDNDRTN